jgi:hypothetical protein
MGENSNGRYVKFANGFMLCYDRVSNDYGSTNPYPITFPVEFYENPVGAVSSVRSLDYSSLEGSSVNWSTTSGEHWQMDGGGGQSTQTSLAIWTAFGKWKEFCQQ